MRASATYFYSSWERAQQDYLDQDEDGDNTVVDSLSRLFELASQFDDAVDSQKEEETADAIQNQPNHLLEQLTSMVREAKSKATELKSLALSSCSTSDQSNLVQDASEQVTDRLAQVEKLLTDN